MSEDYDRFMAALEARERGLARCHWCGLPIAGDCYLYVCHHEECIQWDALYCAGCRGNHRHAEEGAS